MTEIADPAAALIEDPRAFQRLFGKAGVPTCLVAPDGRCLEANDALCRLLRRDRADVVGHSMMELTDPRDVDLSLAMMDLALQGKMERLVFRKRCLDSGGRAVPVLMNSSLVRDRDARPAFFLSQVDDVSDRERIAKRLRETDAKYRNLVDRLPAVAYTAEFEDGDAGAKWHYVNPQIEDLLGYTQAEWLADPLLWSRRVHPDDLERVLKVERHSLEAGPALWVEYRMQRRDGAVIWVHDEASIVKARAQAPALIQGFLIDITRQKQVEAQKAAIVRLSDRALRGLDLSSLLDEAASLVAQTLDLPLVKVLRLEAAGEQLSLIAGVGWDEGLIGEATVPAGINSQAGYTLAKDAALVVEDLGTEKRFVGPALLFDHDVVSGLSVVIHGPDGPYGVLGAHDTSRRSFTDDDADFLQGVANVLAAALARHESDAKARRRALHDELTGLPNRSYLLGRLGQLVSTPAPREKGIALLLVDLDGFKRINDSFGPATGDRLLVESARRLESVLRQGETLARLGGDVFALIVEHDSDDPVVNRAEQVAKALGEPFEHGHGARHRLTCSIGIATTNDKRRSSETLLADAETAVERAKQQGGGQYEFFDERHQQHLTTLRERERELREALETDQLEVHYQPIVSLADGRMVAVEALVRWNHPRLGPLPPSEFIPLAEERRLISRIGDFVLAEASETAGLWREHSEAAKDIRICVNLSAQQLTDPGLPGRVQALLDAHDLPPEQLALELTESALTLDMPVEVLRELGALGVKIALDDFGTGYSSLNHLRRFPIDILKIDRTFVEELEADPFDRAIVTAVLRMATTLGLEVVGEGVERPEQADLLAQAGCAYAQGYLFAKPLPERDFAALLDSLE